MSVERISSRYAKSLIDLASDQGILERILEDIILFGETIKNRELLLLVKSPIVKSDKKRSIFKLIFGGKIHTLTAAFFDLVIRKGREPYLPEIGNSFIRQYKLLNNITSATLTTAVLLKESLINSITDELREYGIGEGKLEIETKVDHDIIGGFILEVDNTLYDTSVKSKLKDVKKEILDNTYIKSL